MSCTIDYFDIVYHVLNIRLYITTTVQKIDPNCPWHHEEEKWFIMYRSVIAVGHSATATHMDHPQSYLDRSAHESNSVRAV